MIYKGTIIEIYYDSIVVMAEDCTFKRIKKSNGLEEGMEIYFEDRDIIKNSNFTIKNISKGVAAVFIFVVTSLYVLGFWNENNKSIALLAVDINPSVEMEINKNYRVIKVLALNEEASKLPLEDLKNYPLIDALEEIVEMAETAGYLRKDESNQVVVTSVELKSNNESDKNLDDLIMEGKKKIEEVSNERGQEIEVVTIKSDTETLAKAKEENISVGKMEIYRKMEDENKNQDKNEITELKDEKSEEFIKEVEKNEKVKKDNNNENKVHKNDLIKEEKENNKNKKEKENNKNKEGNENSKNKKDKENNKNKEGNGNSKDKKDKENNKNKKENENSKNKKDKENGKNK